MWVFGNTYSSWTSPIIPFHIIWEVSLAVIVKDHLRAHLSFPCLSCSPCFSPYTNLWTSCLRSGMIVITGFMRAVYYKPLSRCCSLHEGQCFCKRIVKLSSFLARHIYAFTEQLLTWIVSRSLFLSLSSTCTFSKCNYHGSSLPNAADVSPLHTLTVFHSSLTLNDKQLAVWHWVRTAFHYTLIMSGKKSKYSFVTALASHNTWHRSPTASGEMQFMLLAHYLKLWLLYSNGVDEASHPGQVMYGRKLDMFPFWEDVSPLIQEASWVLISRRGAAGFETLHGSVLTESVWAPSVRVIMATCGLVGWAQPPFTPQLTLFDIDSVRTLPHRV